MSLTSYRTAPPRVIACVWAAGSSPGEPGVGRVWKAWRRPTLPRLEAQYHRRRGFSRPSSGWDRVFGPSLWPPGRPKPPSAPASLASGGANGAPAPDRVRGKLQPVWSAGSELCGVFWRRVCRPGFRRNWRCACRRGGTRVPPEMGPGLRRGTRAPDGAPDLSGLAGSLAFGGTLFRLSPRRNQGSAG